MSILCETQIISASVEFLPRKFRFPMRLSSGLIETITEARATVRVQLRGSEQIGRGAIYLSDLWAWPDHSLSHEERDERLRQKCKGIASKITELTGGSAHPLELGLRLHHAVCHHGEKMPVLASALCASPFDAAIHDAVGQALAKSAFSFYDEDAAVPSADRYFSEGAVRAIAQTLRTPQDALEGWWIVNAHDDLDGEIARAIHQQGFQCFKIKLLGKEIVEDVHRVSDIYQAVRRHGVADPKLSLDSNEGHTSADEVAVFLGRLQKEEAPAYEAICYLEQPTNRDIRRHSFDWKSVAAHKPVILDEGLTDLDLLPLALEQGWSGLALKTCKGHSFNLVAAAWARRHNLLLTMQDLTNPGLAAIHSWLFASHLPVMNGIELNSPQFTPEANESWLPKLDGLFAVRDGKHRFDPGVKGLGSRL